MLSMTQFLQIMSYEKALVEMVGYHKQTCEGKIILTFIPLDGYKGLLRKWFQWGLRYMEIGD